MQINFKNIKQNAVKNIGYKSPITSSFNTNNQKLAQLKEDKFELSNSSNKTSQAKNSIAFGSIVKSILNFKLSKVNTSPLEGEMGAIETLATYKKGGDSEINQGLRLGKVSESTMENIRNIDYLFDSLPTLEEDKKVYRGIGIRQNSSYAKKMQNLKVGDIMHDDGYLSTTSDIDITSIFTENNGYLFKINVPKGNKVIDVESYRSIPIFRELTTTIRNEGEILLPRGSNLKIKEIEPIINGGVIVKADYIGATPKEPKVIDLSTPEKRTDFTTEKLYAFKDAASNRYLLRVLKRCIEEKRDEDVKKIVQICLDREEATNDTTVLQMLISPPDYTFNTIVTILKYFDTPESIDELMPFVEKVRTIDKKHLNTELSYFPLENSFNFAINQYPASEKMLNILYENNVLRKDDI